MSIIDSSFSPPTIISFNSKDRIAGTNSNFISKPIDLGINKYNAVCIVQASIPKSYFNMPNNYNTFTLVELGIPITISVPIGNYTKINLATKLSSLLTTASTTLGNNWIYKCTYPDYTEADDFRFTFTVSGNAGNQPSFIFLDNSPFRQLGFEVDTYIFVANVLKSINAINLSYILRAFIKSNIVSETTDNILEEILNVGSFPPQSIVYFQQYNFDMNSKPLERNINNSWNFYLEDSFNQPIDLNGVPWAFTLCFFQRTITHELHKQELLISNEERLFNIEQQQQQLKSIIQPESKDDNVIKPIYGVQAFTNTIIDSLLEPLPKII